MLQLTVNVTLILLIFGLIVFGYFSFTSNLQETRIISYDSPPRIQRFKRQLLNNSIKKNTSSQPSANHTSFIGLKILDKYLDSTCKKGLVKQNFLTYKKKFNISEAFPNRFEQYIRFINGYPAIAFSINVPSFECFQQTAFSSFFDKLYPIYLLWKKKSINVFEISDIPINNLIILMHSLQSLVFIFLDMNFDSAKVSDGSNCPLVARCKFNLQYTKTKRYVLKMQFSKFIKKMKALQPQSNSFSLYIASNFSTTIPFNIIKSKLWDVVIFHIQGVDSQRNANMKNIEVDVKERLSKKLKNFNSSILYSIFSDEITNNFNYYEKNGNLMKNGAKRMGFSQIQQLDSTSNKEQIEIVNSLFLHHFTNDMTNISSDVQFENMGTGIIALRKKESYYFSFDISLYQVGLLDLQMPVMTNIKFDENIQEALELVYSFSPEDKAEFDLFNAITEMLYLSYRLKYAADNEE